MELVFKYDGKGFREMARKMPMRFEQMIRKLTAWAETESHNQLKSGPNRAWKTGELAQRRLGSTVRGYGGEAQGEVYTTGYGVYVHEGTGIYGPTGRPYTITAVNAKALMIPVGGGEVIFRKKVTIKGMRPRPFIWEGIKRVLKPDYLSRAWRQVFGKQ